jgi:O-6-methylguanine DNA methyltransferase
MIAEGELESQYGKIYFTAEYDPPVNGETAGAHLVYCGFAPWNAPGSRVPRPLRSRLETLASAAIAPERTPQGRTPTVQHTPAGPLAETEARTIVGELADRLSEAISSARTISPGRTTAPLPPIRFYGSDFQKQVWRALLMIPRGHVCSYGDIAAAVGRPGAVRAVGSAVGSNPLAPLVPCHRVLPAGGGIGNYGGGSEKKRRLLEIEKAPLSADRNDPRYFFFTKNCRS